MRFVFDLDGTIVFQGRPIAAIIQEALDDLLAQGHEVIFASARPIRDMLPVIPERYHSLPMIGGNGSFVMQNRTNRFVATFPDEQLKAILLLMEQYQCTYLIDGEWDYAFTGVPDHPIRNNVDPLRLAKQVPIEALGTMVKILILSSLDMEALYEQLTPFDIVIHRHGKENVLDISPTGIHKWSSPQKLGVMPKGFVAFGNDANDIAMFQHAIHSVRIGGHEDLALHSTETVELSGEVEQVIAAKINELSRYYSNLE
ncbi:HAD family hydrolase [Gorillibacterium sp. CAU 1737]|uniref:HAD family hydrolase n=1 Tax=Gorillibacterium sp. CAU 1737 TaxID=3140362 RepID=UPI003260FDEE